MNNIQKEYREEFGGIVDQYLISYSSDRAYKLTGTTSIDQYNAGQETFHMHLDDAVMYVNPYFVVTPKGYTKHYYNGKQRIAAQIGVLDDLPDDIIDTSAVAREHQQMSMKNNKYRTNIR